MFWRRGEVGTGTRTEDLKPERNKLQPTLEKALAKRRELEENN